MAGLERNIQVEAERLDVTAMLNPGVLVADEQFQVEKRQ
jgi:hypothetical protein